MKTLYLKKGRTLDNGTTAIDGAIEIFLRKQYDTQSITSVSEIPTKNGSTTVCNCEGSIKIDEFTQKQLKYFFDVELPIDSYVNIKVGVWGTWGKAFAKFQMAEGDRCMFILNEIKLSSFTRKDGTIGYELRATAFDFKQTYKKVNEDGTRVPSAAAIAAPAYSGRTATPASATAPATAPPVTQQALSVDDLAALDDSDDLPF